MPKIMYERLSPLGKNIDVKSEKFPGLDWKKKNDFRIKGNRDAQKKFAKNYPGRFKKYRALRYYNSILKRFYVGRQINKQKRFR